MGRVSDEAGQTRSHVKKEKKPRTCRERQVGVRLQVHAKVFRYLRSGVGVLLGACTLLGLADHSICPDVPPWSPGTSEQHVRIRFVKKKKVIIKKRKKLTRPRPLVTTGPPVITTPAGALDLPEEKEPGTALLGGPAQTCSPWATY